MSSSPCLCLAICLVSSSPFVCVWQSVSMSSSLCLSVCMCLAACVCLSGNLCLYPATCLSVHCKLYPCLCLAVCKFVSGSWCPCLSGSLQVLCVWQSVLVWQSASPFVSSSLRLSESCNPCVCVCVVCICVWQSVPVSVCAWQSACVCDVINKPIKCDTSVKYATSQSVCSSMVMSETIWLCLEFLFDGKSMSVATLYEPENGNMCTFSPFSDHHSSSVGVPLNWMTKTKIQIGQQIFQTPAQVYDILPSTTAVFSYAIGSRKLSTNEQLFFVGAQTVVSLLQTSQIISDVCFIMDHVAYASSKKSKNRLNRDGTLFF